MKIFRESEYLSKMDPKILYYPTDIKVLVDKIAEKIDHDYQQLVSDNQELILVGVLSGAIHFLSDLSRTLSTPHKLEFINATSYIDTNSSGEVIIRNTTFKASLENQHVIIVDEIVDTGRTIEKLMQFFNAQGCASVECATLLTKPTERVVEDLHVKYVGDVLDPPEFVVGYGLDYNERYRDLPYICKYKE